MNFLYSQSQYYRSLSRTRSGLSAKSSVSWSNSVELTPRQLADLVREEDGEDNGDNSEMEHAKLSKRPSVARRLSTAIQKVFTKEQGIADIDLSSVSAQIRHRPESLSQLCKTTKFSKKELQLMYRGFKQGCPNGVVSLEEFKEIYAQFFPHGHKSNADTGRYAVYVFNTFDRDKNGHISFEEFVVGLSILSRGTMDDKLRWIFDLYDVDQDGLLTKEDIEQVVGSMYEMMGTPTDPPIEENTIADHIDFVFSKMDDNGDGSITLEEFLESCKHDACICESLGLFDTILSSVAVEYLRRSSNVF